MKRLANVLTFTSKLALSLAMTASASFVVGVESAYSAPTKLPEKRVSKTKPKRTFIDFSNDDKAVIAKPASPFDEMLRKSDQDVAAANAPTQIRSRKILAAPPGDSAEPMSSFRATVVTKPTPKQRAPIAKTSPTPVPVAVATPAPYVAPVVVAPLKPSPSPLAKATPVPQVETIVEASPEFVGPAEFIGPQDDVTPVERIAVVEQIPTSSIAPSPRDIPMISAMTVTTTSKSADVDPVVSTRLFLRTGFLQAHYSDFDSRMKDTATSTGVGLARDFTTPWGSIEGRAALDIFHASDQSVTLDNIRMVMARADAAYWFSHGFIKPGASMGLGWANYSIRSYRTGGSTNLQDVTLRTHAKSNALALIPAANLRVDLTKEITFDIQGEYLGLVGGDSAGTAGGLSITGALGWLF